MNNDELLEWVRSEAIGFRDTKPFPEYEKIATQFDMVVDVIESLQARVKKLETGIQHSLFTDESFEQIRFSLERLLPEQPE